MDFDNNLRWVPLLRRGEDRPAVAQEELQMSRFCVALVAAMASVCGQASKYFLILDTGVLQCFAYVIRKTQ